MASCDCTFAYWSVIPPTHCPMCGRCLTCGQGVSPRPVSPYPYRPYPVTTQPPPWRTWGNTSISYNTACDSPPLSETAA